LGGKLILILGGARSGKSAFAQQLASALGSKVLFVATAEAGDDEMAARIARHRAQRPAGWRTLEAPRAVGQAIQRLSWPAQVVLLDCLTLLASNVVGALGPPLSVEAAEQALQQEVEGLLEAYRADRASWIVVSNEVGWGIVPDSLLARAYRDALGRANASLAQAADEVYLLVAGLRMRLKPPPASGI
jgi:adenosylcobinamide kinase/adenosylcobinamide-phosphate guanylyltransferase